MTRATAAVLGVLTLLAFPAADARAQCWGRMGGWIGYGSTVQGDIARGEGVFLTGLGSYYLDSAVAGSVNADTSMRVYNFVADVIRTSNRDKAEHRLAVLRERIRTYDEIRNRIRNDPSLSDLHKGDALNDLLIPLLAPKRSPSELRFATVAVPGEAIRQIPLKIGKDRATFSLDRLMARDRWPVRLRSDQFARGRKAFGDALDMALDEMVHEKILPGAVQDVRAAVRNLQDMLERLAPAQRPHDDLYIQAKNHLDDLAEFGRVIAIPEVEQALKAVESYHGTNVGDLLMFLDVQHVRFGVAETAVERELYRNLYAALVQQEGLFAAARELEPVKVAPRAKAEVNGGEENRAH
jgi:hypothetical protein